MKILVINGPNLNLLGKREKSFYGTITLSEIQKRLLQVASELSDKLNVPIDLVFFQSNYEGAIVEKIQKSAEENVKAIIINPGAYTHTSIAIRDALLATGIPFIEVHISNVFAREKFRHKSYLSDIATGVIIGLGEIGYELALIGLVQKLLKESE